MNHNIEVLSKLVKGNKLNCIKSKIYILEPTYKDMICRKCFGDGRKNTIMSLKMFLSEVYVAVQKDLDLALKTKQIDVITTWRTTLEKLCTGIEALMATYNDDVETHASFRNLRDVYLVEQIGKISLFISKHRI